MICCKSDILWGLVALPHSKYPKPRAVICKFPCTLLPSKLPNTLQESTASDFFSLGAFGNFFFRLLLTSPKTCSTWRSSACSSNRRESSLFSVWYSGLPPLRRWFISLFQAAQLVGSCVNKSPAKIWSPAASWMFIRTSSQGIATTVSMLSCISCDTPLSTLKWWFSWPRYHVMSSEQERMVQMIATKIVHSPPPRLVEVYDGFVFAVSGRLVCNRNIDKYNNLLKLTKGIERL